MQVFLTMNISNLQEARSIYNGQCILMIDTAGSLTLHGASRFHGGAFRVIKCDIKIGSRANLRQIILGSLLYIIRSE